MALVTLLFVGYCVVLPLHIFDEAAKERQAELIVQAIKAHDGTINASATVKKGYATVRVYAVTDPSIQDMIIAWVKEMKDRGEVGRSIAINFYVSENMIYTPVAKDGSWGSYRGPEEVIRSITL
jgi:hypothetical protein